MTTKDFYGWETIVGMTKDGQPITEIESPIIDFDAIYTVKPGIDYFEFAKMLKEDWHIVKEPTKEETK